MSYIRYDLRPCSSSTRSQVRIPYGLELPSALCPHRQPAFARQALAAAPPSPTPAFSPLYQQIKGLILQSLQAGEWKPGEVIPSEMELAARFKVSQGTVRKAIDDLAAENLVMRRQGKGTFVATHAEQQVQYRFLEAACPMSAIWTSKAQPQRNILDCKRVRASAEMARSLALRTGDTVVQVRRILAFSGVPDHSGRHLAARPGLQRPDAEQMASYHGPTYAMFEMELRRAHGARG